MLIIEDWERLKQIREEMRDLLEEAKNLVRRSGDRHQSERANSYWIPGIDNYIAGSSRFGGCNMDDTIKALEPEDDEDQELEDEDEEIPDC